VLRSIAWFIVALVLALGTAGAAGAQDASPVAGPTAHDVSLLKALGLPEIDLVATATGVTGLPDTLAAGRYLVSLENQTADQEIQVYLAVLPDTVTPEQANADLAKDDVPAWAYDAVWAGGPSPAAGETDAVVVNLSEGSWWAAVDRSSDDAAQPQDSSQPLTVTGGTPTAEAAAPSGAVAVTMTEYTFEVPAGLAAGPQIWDLSNAGEQPHFLVLWGVPEGTTMQQVMDTIGAFGSGTPVPGMLAFQYLRDVYDTTFVSGGQHEWIQVDLDAGTYAAVCFFPDRASGAPHALMGMITVFTVA